MPIYEYECKDCGKTFEAFLGIRDGAVTECSHCKSPRIKKLISNCSFQLKGTGWYLTDYARKENSNGNGSRTSKSSAARESEKTTDPAKAESGNESKDSSTDTATKDSGKAA